MEHVYIDDEHVIIYYLIYKIKIKTKTILNIDMNEDLETSYILLF